MSAAKKLIKIDNGQERFEEYEELLVRRDQLFKEAVSYLTVYTAEFGDLITENFKLKIECIKKKKTINYCRRRMNRGLAIDTANMQAEIEREMKLYYEDLKKMMADTESAKNAKDVGEFRFNRAKKIYRRLAKILHPDINKRTEADDYLSELWRRIVIAYRCSDTDALDDLEVLVRRAMEDLGEKGFELDNTDIEKRIERVEGEINEILTTEPYIYGEILKDEEKSNALKEQLKIERDDYEQYLETLTKTLEAVLREGGATLIWKMN